MVVKCPLRMGKLQKEADEKITETQMYCGQKNKSYLKCMPHFLVSLSSF